MSGLLGPAIVGGISSLMVTLLWVAVALMVVWTILAATQKSPAGTGASETTVVPSGTDPAVEIVRARFSRGEIDRAEYERLVTALLGPT
jgi:uncharacterized membrane protein